MKPAVFDALRDAINALVMAQRATNISQFKLFLRLAKQDIDRAERISAEQENT